MVTFHIVWTSVLFAIFIGIVWWAWSGGRKARFDEAARLPLEDDVPEGGYARPPRERVDD